VKETRHNHQIYLVVEDKSSVANINWQES